MELNVYVYIVDEWRQARASEKRSRCATTATQTRNIVFALAASRNEGHRSITACTVPLYVCISFAEYCGLASFVRASLDNFAAMKPHMSDCWEAMGIKTKTYHARARYIATVINATSDVL